MDQADLDRELQEVKRHRQAERARQAQQRNELMLAVRMALHGVPAGFFRELGKPRAGDGEVAGKVVAQAVIEHLERAGYVILSRKVQDENGRLVERPMTELT